MKKITHKQTAKFIQATSALFASLGFSPGKHDYLRIMTKFGKYEVSQVNEYTCCLYYNINGRFDDAATAAAHLGDSVNPYSGKWNILTDDPAAALDEFARRMRRIDARPATPEELAAWAEQDIANDIKWSGAFAAILENQAA